MGYAQEFHSTSPTFADTTCFRKSQLAISYGDSVQNSSPDTWVFWVDAESKTKFEQGYRDIANAVCLRGRNDKDADHLSLVYDWLRDTSKGNWVMILDNADDKDVFTSRPSIHRHPESEKQIRDFLPQTSNGSILVTSRSRDAAFQVTCNYKHILTVEPMTEREAMDLLQSQLDEAHPEHEMKLLAETLGFVPLAISQAAANISRRSLLIREYLDELKNGDERFESLLDESSPQLRRNSGQSNSIVATWKVTFEYVRRTAPSAARLLSLMCLFDRQEIPQALLQGRYGEDVICMLPKPRKPWWKRRPRSKQRKAQLVPLKTPSCDFEDDWLVLRDFSMIKKNKDRKNFSMHPMVQFTTKKWLVLQKELDAWSHRFISIMDVNFPNPDNGNFKFCEPLLAHAYAAVPYRPADSAIRPLQAWASMTRKLASFCYQGTALDTAQKLYVVAAGAHELSLGASAPQSLLCNTQLGTLLSVVGKKAEAETIHRRVLTLRSDALGLEHPDSLDTMDHIGDALAFQHRYTEAEQFHVQALDARLRMFGPAHEDTQSAFNKRGIFLFSRGRYDEAYNIWHQAYEARAQGNKHIFDSSWANELGMIGLRLFISGDAAKAERYFTEAIAEKEKVPPGRDLMQCITCFARVLAEQGDLTGAERQFKRAFQWYDQTATIEYPERIQTMGELASILSKLDQLEEAGKLARRCLAERLETQGKDGEREISESKWILAGILEKQSHFDQALMMYKEAFEGAKDVLGERHEDTKDYWREYERLLKEIRETVPGTVRAEEAILMHADDHADTTAGAQEDDISPPRQEREYTNLKSEMRAGSHNETAVVLNAQLTFGGGMSLHGENNITHIKGQSGDSVRMDYTSSITA
jgi:tetratricopeptide (TPR) repeat protein